MYSYKLSFSVLAGLMAITLFPANILASLPFGLAGPEGAVLFLNGFHFVSGHNDYEVSANHYCVIIRDDMLQCVVYNTATTPAHLAGIEYIVTEEAFETLDFEERQLWHSHQYEVTSGFLIEPGLPSVVDHTIMKDVLINTYGKTIHTWRYDQKDSLYPVGVPELVMGFTHDDQITPDFVEARDVLFGTNTTEIRDSRRDITPHDVLPGADSWKYGFSLSFGIVNTTINTGDLTSSCPQNVTITNQDDIENGPLASCGDQLLFIQIEKAFGVLDFTNLISAEDINVHDSPQLEILSFPKLTILSSLVIDQATSLTELSMPMLSSTPPAFVSEDGNIVFGPLDLNITGAPVLTDLIMMNATDFGSLKLVNFGDGVDEFNQMSLADAQSAFSFEIASCLSLRDLRSVVDLHVIGGAGCSYPFSLSSVYDFTVTNSYATRVSLEAAMQVNNSLLVENSVYPVDHDSDFLQSYGTTVELGQITSVGSDATITSNANAHIDLSGLASIDAGLSVHNNTNCSFNFDQISRIGKSLEMMDNIETTLPLFSNLERAENIHLRGIINTTAGPNIFPALIYIPGTVTVEAWNDDFNCSKLVSQWHDRVINNLVCNGTDNGNTAGLAPNDGMDTSSNNGLSQGAWAGIGIGIGITVLGLATAIIWVMMHFKRRLNELAAARGGGEEVLLPVQYDTSTREPARSNTGISFFSEVEGSSPVHKYDKMEPPIYELSVMPVELPATTVSPKK